MIKVVCADGRVLDEIIDRSWLHSQLERIDSHQITTPSGCQVKFSSEEAAHLRESCRKMTMIPQPHRPSDRATDETKD